MHLPTNLGRTLRRQLRRNAREHGQLTSKHPGCSGRPAFVNETQKEVLVNLNKRIIRQVMVATVAITGLTFGVAAPALAEGHFNSVVIRVNSGFESRQWIDRNSDGEDTRATFFNCNKDDFVVKIMKEDAGPDTEMARESLQCTLRRADAVRAGDVPADEYHFTFVSGSSVTADLTVYW
jgi:hypothetical protein